MRYTLPQLAYSYAALEPYIDAKTMEIHHTKHHQTYINTLNTALEGTSFVGQTIEQLLRRIDTLPDNLKPVVKNHGGGHANHSLFWTIMSPQGGGDPHPALAKIMDRDLGGVAAWKEAFTKAALSRFGSGWAWLSVTPKKTLVVESTPNQDSPLFTANTPILGLDVWEHAYYLNYQNRRPDYVAAFFQVIDWGAVQRRFDAALHDDVSP